MEGRQLIPMEEVARLEQIPQALVLTDGRFFDSYDLGEI